MTKMMKINAALDSCGGGRVNMLHDGTFILFQTLSLSLLLDENLCRFRRVTRDFLKRAVDATKELNMCAASSYAKTTSTARRALGMYQFLG
eukprot:CAMPEP_0116860718 /NCGR_PEP_ID=MMETSP0418-20121206/22586_1 /TAXON_ID=1158023 /ORGANISM="Astrosyne radiata, Strain 13vi08-1A" /LENGTH=90 /DNA_ID=CAMNT_0004495187 /DNA_START=125 /DNA_END=397 /DNA_ORIENTATION=-